MIRGKIKIQIADDGSLSVDMREMKATGGSTELRALLSEMGQAFGGEVEEGHKPGHTHLHEHDHDHHHLHV